MLVQFSPNERTSHAEATSRIWQFSITETVSQQGRSLRKECFMVNLIVCLCDMTKFDSIVGSHYWVFCILQHLTVIMVQMSTRVQWGTCMTCNYKTPASVKRSRHYFLWRKDPFEKSDASIPRKYLRVRICLTPNCWLKKSLTVDSSYGQLRI